MPTGRAVTLHDVAREAGVSLATASRVLNGSTRTVATAYRTRVEAAAERLGYTANLQAQATARGSASTIALLVPDIADPYFGRIAAGVARGADEAGLIVTVAVTDRDEGREAGLVRVLRGQRPRGLILAGSRGQVDDARLETEVQGLVRAGGTAVALGAGGDDMRVVPLDNVAGAAALAEQLAALGHRSAVVLGAEQGVRTSDERIAGFREGLERAGGDVVATYHGAFTRDGGQGLAGRLLADGLEEGTLVFGVSDLLAIGAMSVLRAAGREIGADVAVAGFGDIVTTRDVTPRLTTVHVPLEDVGYALLRAAIDDDWHGTSDEFELSPVIRESTPRVSRTAR